MRVRRFDRLPCFHVAPPAPVQIQAFTDSLEATKPPRAPRRSTDVPRVLRGFATSSKSVRKDVDESASAICTQAGGTVPDPTPASDVTGWYKFTGWAEKHASDGFMEQFLPHSAT
jgi:hypothetical protein